LDLPVRVMIHCPPLELKNRPGRLVSVSPHGYYEVYLDFSERTHTALLPIQQTALIFAEPNSSTESMPELER